MSSLQKIANYDAQNLDLARRVQATPDHYQHLVAWSRNVIARLGTDAERAELEARTGLYASIGTSEAV